MLDRNTARQIGMTKNRRVRAFDRSVMQRNVNRWSLQDIMSMALFGIIFAGALIFAHPVQSANDVIKLATTTSTVNSGLMSYLIPHFENASGQIIQFGTVPDN